MAIQSFSRFFTLLILVGSFYSCNEEDFYQKEYLQRDVDQIINDTIIECNNADEHGLLKSHIITVDFPAAVECSFNESAGATVDDLNQSQNGPRKNEKIRAIIKQSYNATLPQNATICDMEFNFPEQQMQYDDEIFLLLNDFVIISSQNYSNATPSYQDGLMVNKYGFQEFKWLGDNGLYNLDYGWAITPKYCLGLDDSLVDYHVRCDIPATETVGTIKLEIPKEEIIKLSILSQNNPETSVIEKLDFGFVTTGDNDAGDCEHAAYSFNVEVVYADTIK